VEPQKHLSTLDQYISAEMNRLGIPGAAIAITQGDTVVHLKGYGVADPAGAKVTAQTPFYIGSISKSITAVAVMQLVEAGRLELDTPVVNYLPWFRLANKTESDKITLRHLLNQTSGISTKDGNRYWGSQEKLETVIRGLKAIALNHPPGEKFQYSNINYSIAGLLIEKASGEKYGDYIKRHVFAPLKMNHSYTQENEALGNGLAKGHYYMFGGVFAGTGSSPPVYLASGFILSSAEDMAHYLIAHINAGHYGDASILSANGVSILHSTAPEKNHSSFHYAMGWSVKNRNHTTILAHNGDTGYFHGIVLMVKEMGLGVVLLTNASGFEQLAQVDLMANNVLNIINGAGSPTPISLPLSMRALYWGIFILPLFVMLGIGYGVALWQGGVQVANWQWLLSMLGFGSIFVCSIWVLPGFIPFSLTSMRYFYPELAYGLLFNAILGLAGILEYGVIMLRKL